MVGLARTTDPLYADYQADLQARRMRRALPTALAFVIGLNTSFLLLDLWTQTDRFWLFFGIRMVWNAAVLVLWWLEKRISPLFATRLACLITGLALVALSGAAGGVTSNYWPAIMVLFLGMPVLLPLNASQSAGLVTALSATFAALPLVTGESPTFHAYIVPVFFVLSAAVECVASSAVLDSMRFTDFRQRLEVEQARDELEKLDEQKSRFTANVHHELRTPLTLMLAPIDGLLGREFGEISEVQESYLRSMHANGLRLLKLINNLLDLAKIEGAQMRIVRRPVQLGQLVERLVEGARPLAERKGVSLSCEGLEGLPEVYLDGDAIEKVLVNLVGNALKFTPADGSIDLRAALEDGDRLHIVVADTGVGLPEDQLERIFDRFAQVDSSSTRRHEGTGIGLALVRELVELHEGRIWAESEGEDRGTQIHVELPRGTVDVEAAEELIDTAAGQHEASVRDADALAKELGVEDRNRDALRMADMSWTVQRHEDTGMSGDAEAADGPDAPTAPEDAPEVLICDDNPDMRRLIAHFVGREFRLRVATNGREGLEAVHERHPDLVLTDVMMPEMSGTELCKMLKEDPETAGIPVLLVTSKAEREMKIEGLELGADDYVTKPFHPRELMARVRSFVKLRCLQQELAVGNARLESTNVELQATLRELREATVQLAQAERLSAVGELAAGVAHEVNNPVNFAMNSLRTLRDYVEDVRTVIEQVTRIDWRDPRQLERELREIEKLRQQMEFDDMADSLCELVDIVNEGLERTHRLVGDLRDLAAPGGGRQADVSLLRGLETTIQLVKHSYRDAQVELEADLPGFIPPVEGDPRALNQVFLNLLKNAAEAFEGPGGTVRVSAEVGEKEIQVRFRDDGPGVPPDVRARIFQPFFTTKSAGKGSGLGLSISRRIVTEHGGSLEVSSEPGEGTTFTVTLPLQDDDRET